MTSRLALLLIALLPLAACTGQDTAPASTATTPAATAPAETAAPAEAAPAVAPVAEAPNTNPVTAPQGAAPVAGTDYIEITGGQPYEPTNGKIEVVEVFSYTCPHCASFEPLVAAWKARQPADVKFIPVAGPFGANPMPFAKAFYTAQTMGLLDRSHEAMFRAVHLERSLPLTATDAQIGAFYGQFGANPAQFASTMASFAIDAKAKRAVQFMQRAGVESSPNIVVNGKYRVVGRTLEDMLRIADHLVAQERAAAAPAPAADPASGG